MNIMTPVTPKPTSMAMVSIVMASPTSSEFLNIQRTVSALKSSEARAQAGDLLNASGQGSRVGARKGGDQNEGESPTLRQEDGLSGGVSGEEQRARGGTGQAP